MYTVEGKNLMLNALAGGSTHIGLLDNSGVEIIGGGYVRKPVTFNTASNGILTIANLPILFDVPSDAIITKVIFMSALTGGIKYAESDVTGATSFAVDSGQLDLNS